MTLRQLQYIVALDTHRHFAKAADSCCVAQPTLTLQVKKLEEQIGLVIFDRSQQPIEPSPMGKRFITKARQILREVEQLKDLVNQNRNQITGSFRVGIIPSLSQYLLPLFLKDFTTHFPDTTLEIRERQSEVIIQELNDDRLDIGILVTPLEETSLREIPVFYEPFLVYANAGHPILAQELLESTDLPQDGLWLLEKGHCFRNQLLRICNNSGRQQDHRNILLEGGSLETLKRMIRELSGYTLLPELALDLPKDEGLFRRFVEPEPVREVSLVVHKSFTKERLLAELRKSMIRSTPQKFEKNERFMRIAWR